MVTNDCLVVADQVKRLFGDTIFPMFPFQDRGWLAIAFERNNYDNRRVPEWVFRRGICLAEKGSDIIICGYGQPYSSVNGELGAICVSADWSAYSTFMLDRKNYSPDYFIYSTTGNWGLWSDSDLTVFGGDHEMMVPILESLGGTDAAIQFMRKEFGLLDFKTNQELDKYLHALIHREANA